MPWCQAGGCALVLLSMAGPGAAQALPTAAPATHHPVRYWVTLRDKTGVSFDPTRYFSPAAQARRARQHLPAFDAHRPARAARITWPPSRRKSIP